MAEVEVFAGICGFTTRIVGELGGLTRQGLVLTVNALTGKSQ
jgi:hypothetical protein